jgi:protein O-GlcNAc transferase
MLKKNCDKLSPTAPNLVSRICSFRLGDAREQYMEVVVTMHAMDVNQSLQMGLAHQQAGRLVEAEKVYRQILAEHPTHPDALHLLGVIETNNNPASAADHIARAIASNPTVPAYHHSLGLAFAQLKKWNDATNAYRRALELNPAHPMAHFNLGNALFLQNRLEEAAVAYRGHIAISPDTIEAHQNLGCTLQRLGRLEEAERYLRHVIAVRPTLQSAHNNLGILLASRQQYVQALLCYQEALRLAPDFGPALTNLGAALHALGQHREAAEVLQRATQLSGTPEAWNNFSSALKDLGQFDEAFIALGKSLALRPNAPDVLNNMANLCRDNGDVPESIAWYGRALALEPHSLRVHSNMIYSLQFHPGYDEEALFREQRRWNQLHGLPLKQFHRPQENDRDPDRKLRVGYVSPYFYLQAESFFVVPLLEHHDRENFEIHCYATVVRADKLTQRMKDAGVVWHDVLGLEDAPVAEQIRQDGIDVLVDLAMHMAFNRLPIFARKPAPVQAAWLAYPGGTGLDAMDYRITDAYMDAPQSPSKFYSESPYHLPDCWCCYDPLGDDAPAAPRPDGPICFGSINNPCKNNPVHLRLWADIMREIPESRLLMQSFSESDKNRIRGVFKRAGVGAHRLEFVGRKLRPDYLRLYDTIDICLDPLPYNGITTTCDALWMGVPVVTLAGKTPAGRAGRSILSTVGLPELIAGNDTDFKKMTIDLANDRPRLAQYRSTLRQKTLQSPLMDAARFTRNMESAYRDMWRKWCGQNLKSQI